jgi:hypothetical protein
VHTPRGTVPVERVAPGDSVVAWDDSTGAVVVRPVVAVVQRTADTVVTVVAGRDTIRTTPEHPFRVGGAWVRAAALRPGDRLAALQGPPVAVSAVRMRTERLTVHNFEVKGAHTYYVAARGVLVHNQCFAVSLMMRDYERWASQTVTRFRGTSNVSQISDIMSGQLRSKAMVQGVEPTFWNTSFFARVWHSMTSDAPPSQYVSLTRNPDVARQFGGANAFAFEVRQGDLYRAWWNPFGEAEDLVRGGTRISNPRVIPRRRGIPRHRPRRPAPCPLGRHPGRGRGGEGAGRPRTTRGAR